MKEIGEVSAIIGYYKQYEICALELYDALLNNQLESVEFASNELKKLDDVLIVCNDKVIAYQIKDKSENFTYHSFTNIDDKLLEGCFDDVQILKRKYPNKTIEAYYISNQKPSAHDRINSFEGNTKPSFKKFKTEFWDKINSGIENLNSIFPNWNPLIEELKKKTKATDGNLDHFIKTFSFILEDEYTKIKDTYISGNYQRIDDITKIARNIFSIIGKRGNIILNKNQVLREFDLLSRYQTHFKHSFFVDDNHYQPISSTIENLEKLLEKKNNGYIALIGNAGSGKSTLLTKWGKGRKENILKYYAYVNKEINNEFGYRGEAKVFLKDLLIQIREKQFSPQQNLPPDEINLLQKQLFKELDSFKFINEKTFILVDGLDHIEREQKVNRSLIDILPNPEQIPKNVYFILGTRTTNNLEGLPDRIKINLLDEDRVVKIEPLSLSQIKSLIDSHSLNLTQNQLINLHNNTLGHPLFLRYTIEELKLVSQELYNEVISQKDFKGDIYDEYRIFWNKNRDKDSFIEILGIISRLRYSYIDLDVLQFFVKDRNQWEKVQKISEHYFYKKDKIWQYFHNSFKEFLKKETSKNFVTGIIDENINIDFHNKIYNIIKGINNEYNYNILYHLSEAKSFEEITSIGTQDYFREQWFNYRNYKYILEDIKLTAKASYKINKPECLFSCFISYSEINQRINNFFINNYTETFLDLNEISLANSFIFDATEILVSKENVMSYALNIYKKGYKELAFDLLKKAEPTYLIDYSKKVSPNRYDREQLSEIDEVGLILDWVKLKSLYFDLEYIFDKVQSLEIEFDDLQPNRDRNLLVETFEALTDWFIDLEDWDKLIKLEFYLKLIDLDNQFFFYFDVIWYLENNNDFYNECINKLKNWGKSTINSVNKRLSLFQTLILKAPERGKYFFNELVSPKEINTSHSFDRFEEGYLSYIFDYARLYYITTQNYNASPDFFVPTDKKQIITAYYKEFAELGKAFAYIYINKKEAAQGFRFRFKQILNFFHYDVTDYDYEYSMQNNKSNLINLVLRISSKISNEVFNSILSEIETEWKNTRFWKDNDKQKVIELVIELGLNKVWCYEHLNNLDNPIFDDNDINSRIDKGITQIKLWNQLNEISKAKQVLKTIMSISVDIQYEKEYHLDYMIDWLGKIDEIDDELMTYAKSLDSIKYKTNHSFDYMAEQILLHTLNKGNGFVFFKYLIFNGFLNFNDSLEHLFGYFLLKLEDNKSLILKLFSRLVLNFDNSSGARHKFLENLFSINLEDGEIKKIVEEINIHSVLEHRNNYLYRIKELAESKDLDTKELEIEEKVVHKKNTDTPSELRLKNKKSLSFDDVLNQTNSYDDICKLLDAEDKTNSYFRWSRIIINKIHFLSDEEIENLLEKRSFEISELVNISKHLFEHNKDDKIIKKILYKGLDESSKYNWDKSYDGASKLKVYELLNEVEQTSVVKDRIFKDVSNNLEISGNRQFNVLDRIFKLIDNNFSYEKYYPLLKEYKDLILQIHLKENNIPSLNGNFSNEDLLKDLLLFLVEIPSGYDNIIFEILIQEFQHSQVLIEEILKELYNNNFFLRYIKFLSGISLVNLKFVSGYVSEVTTLFNSNRYDIHCISKIILERLEIDYDEMFEFNTTSVPFIYKLELPYNPEIIISEKERMERLDETGYLRSTNDPLEYCHLYLNDIKKISKQTDIEVINIATRVKNLGERNYIEPNWLKGLSEKQIRDIYEYKFELKISYKRPQYQKVWCGLMIVLRELWELGLIDKDLADDISNSFDEYTFLIKPVKKPKFISSIIKNERDYAPSTDERWVYKLNVDYLNETLKFEAKQKIYILAEHSIIAGQGDGLSNETRQAYVEISKIEKGIGKYHNIFNLSDKSYIKDYESINYSSGICIYNWIHYFGKKRNWLAINPRLAKMMNLKLSNDGNFRWLDENRNIVIESFFWQNNYENNRSRNLHSESGYGWYVLISDEGIKRMKRIGINSLFHHKKIFRRLKFTQRNYNTFISEENSHWNITELDF